MAQYYDGTLSIEECMNTTLAGMATLTVKGWVRRFIHRHIMPRVYPAARERIQCHQDRSDKVMIISASNHLVVPIARQLSAYGTLAIGVEIVDECYSGKTHTHGTMTYKKRAK